MTQVYVAVLSLAGFICLMLAMPKHFGFVTQATLGSYQKHFLRGAGWLALLLASLIAVRQWAFDVGLVVWLGWLSLAGVALVFSLPYWPLQGKVVKRPARRATKSARTDKTEETGNSVERDSAPSRQSWRQAAIAGCMVLLLAVVAWQYLQTPVKPLLREDAYHGRIGPWDYTLVEINTEAPEVEALQLGIKEFLIRFCDSCNAEIRIAYLKVREPRTLRSAGMSFLGNQQRYIELPIPPKVILEDGLWLTVVSKQGEVFQQCLDIEQVSPAMAEFIRKQS
ncbi:DUF3325 domain-containing protein [Pseudomonas sp. FME51]|uniref:DUF3325 domain-containing protein n=1 Tax=Pseudomonas sp. FME51 TaxID=2742609 RepID=UPI0018680A22|nr:DUF3325 domain-containing protein [Pseudomonas sp. FME51]